MGWNPWRELRNRPEITFGRCPLPGPISGVYATKKGFAVILIEETLTRRDRNAVLAHELIHAERGGSIDARWMPGTWTAVIAREEILVDREVARRLVPLDELAGFVQRHADTNGCVVAADVAEEFDVPTSGRGDRLDAPRGE